MSIAGAGFFGTSAHHCKKFAFDLHRLTRTGSANLLHELQKMRVEQAKVLAEHGGEVGQTLRGWIMAEVRDFRGAGQIIGVFSRAGFGQVKR